MFPWRKRDSVSAVSCLLSSITRDYRTCPGGQFPNQHHPSYHLNKWLCITGKAACSWGISHRGDCHLLLHSDCSVVRSVNLWEQKAKVPAGDWINSPGCRYLACGGALCGSSGYWETWNTALIKQKNTLEWEPEFCPQKSQSPLSPGSWLLSAAAAVLPFSVIQEEWGPFPPQICSTWSSGHFSNLREVEAQTFTGLEEPRMQVWCFSQQGSQLSARSRAWCFVMKSS